jgi:3',5'-cyclic AMP phosphodiesterase CpdA
MVARLCLSDLHLGDPRSVLSDPGVAEQVAKRIGLLTGGRIEQLVLNGDVWEECTPDRMDERTSAGFARSVVSASNLFFWFLTLHNQIDEVVWIPGNHDLSLLHQLVGHVFTTSPKGALVGDGMLKYLLGRSEFVRLAYPVFVPEGAWALFSHGHLMDPLVRGIAPDIEYAALAALGCPRPVTSPEEASLSKIAERTDPFSLALWKRYSRLDEAYQKYVLRRFDRIPSDPKALWADRGQASVSAGMAIDTATGSLFPHVDWFLTAALLDPRIPTPVSKNEPMTFVFGHDHLGTRAWRQVCDQSVLVCDSGGWTSDYRGHRPHSRVLVWDKKDDPYPRLYYVATPGLP